MDSGRRKVPWTTRPRHNVSRQPAALSKVPWRAGQMEGGSGSFVMTLRGSPLVLQAA